MEILRVVIAPVCGIIGALRKERDNEILYLDLRRSADLGEMRRSDGTPVYKRVGMLSIMAGCRYGFIKQNRPASAGG